MRTECTSTRWDVINQGLNLKISNGDWMYTRHILELNGNFLYLLAFSSVLLASRDTLCPYL